MNQGEPEKQVDFRLILLIGFLTHIMIIYPVVNRLDSAGLVNRLILLGLVVLVFVAYRRQWWLTTIGRWDAPTTALYTYLLMIIVSALVSVANGIQSPSALLTYGLNSFTPIILFGCFVNFQRRNFLINAIIAFTALNIVVGALTFAPLGLRVGPLADTLGPLIFDPDAHRLVSLVGKSTVVGYLALFSFSWILFFGGSAWRYPMLLLFGAAVVMSFQRSMWFGLIFAVCTYFFLAPSSQRRKISDLSVVALGVPLLTWVILDRFNLTAVVRLVLDRIVEFNLSDAWAERASQQLLLNDEHFLKVLFGEGYGKYSPLNKEENVLNLPDAPYFMIFNETGVVGLSLFVGVLTAFLVRAVRRRNIFQVWFVAHLAIVLLGSRILWYFPLNFLILMILAVLKDDLNDQPYHNK